jgi:hypothetical protein
VIPVENTTLSLEDGGGCLANVNIFPYLHILDILKQEYCNRFEEDESLNPPDIVRLHIGKSSNTVSETAQKIRTLHQLPPPATDCMVGFGLPGLASFV